MAKPKSVPRLSSKAGRLPDASFHVATPIGLFGLVLAGIAVLTVSFAAAQVMQHPAPCLPGSSSAVSVRNTAASDRTPTLLAAPAGPTTISGYSQSDSITNSYNPAAASTQPLQSAGTPANSSPLQAAPGLQDLDPSQL